MIHVIDGLQKFAFDKTFITLDQMIHIIPDILKNYLDFNNVERVKISEFIEFLTDNLVRLQYLKMIGPHWAVTLQTVLVCLIFKKFILDTIDGYDLFDCTRIHFYRRSFKQMIHML